MRKSIVAVALLFSVILAACGSKELSSSKAAKLIKEKYYTQQMIENGAQTTQVSEMKDQVVGQSGSVFGIRGEDVPRVVESFQRRLG
jgi:ABC-type enterochelin transport system substrate-binding protein